MAALVLLFYLAVLLHIVCFAAWFGLGLGLTRQSRTVLAAEPAVGVVLAAEGTRTIKLMTLFVALAYVFALVAFFTNPKFISLGMAGYEWPYHTALTLGLLLVVVQFLLVRPSWGRLQAAVGAPEAEAARKRLAMGVGIGHTLWLVLLVLMFWTQLVAAATL
ncbi:MAG: hypothetical protein HKN04_04010 [Rhodothermaceae bacterium]|nr:hypothetical protein [Rhodothermaceae bacterium]